MRVALALWFLGILVAAGASSAAAEPTPAAKPWVPEVLVYYLHETGLCPPLGQVDRSLDRNDTATDARCTYRALANRDVEHKFVYETEAMMPVAIDEPGRSARLTLDVSLDRDGREVCIYLVCGRNGVTFEFTYTITIGTSTCTKAYEVYKWRLYVPSTQQINLDCSLSGTTKKTDIVKVELAIKTNANIAFSFEGKNAGRVTLGVLLNPPVAVKQVGALLPPASPSPTPVIAAGLLGLVALAIRRRYDAP